MKVIFIFAILLFLIPFSSSISTNILPTYRPGETMILEGWNEIEDKDLKSKIKQYIITSDAFTDSEKNLLQ